MVSSARKAGPRRYRRSHRWIVDPLDGTTNFLHGIPQFAVSIALERDGVIVAGLAYNPANDELFVAERGKGAFLNDQRIRVAGAAAARRRRRRLRPAALRPRRSALARNEIAAAQQNFAGLRRYGAAALDLAWVAAGRLDAYWERDLSPWDMAAGIILVREAGGFVTDLDGGDAMFAKGQIVAGNDTMHRELLRLLKRQARRPTGTDRRGPVRHRAITLPQMLAPRAKWAKCGGRRQHVTADSPGRRTCVFLSHALCHIGGDSARIEPDRWRATSIRAVLTPHLPHPDAGVPDPCGLIAFVLQRQIFNAFLAIPWLNALIVGVLVIGIILSFHHVIRLFPEVAWVNSFRSADPNLPPSGSPNCWRRWRPCSAANGSIAWRCRRRSCAPFCRIR